MEQYFKENILIVVSFIGISVWFILNCINENYKKKWLYIVELFVLLMNIIYDICFALITGIKTEAVSITMQLIAMAALCAILSIVVLKNFYKNRYKTKH